MASKPLSVLIVRDRPIRYEPSQFGGSLVAAERGYCPVSHTGYRSLARCLDAGDAPPPSLEFLEDLAVANDRQTAEVLRTTRRTLATSTPNGLAYFDVLRAVEYGFFATDADRGSLWQHAYLLADRILCDALLQPSAETLPAWTTEQRFQTLHRTELLRTWLSQLLAGNITCPPEQIHFFASYWQLPERPTPEPSFALPVVTAELSLALPPSPDTDPAGGELFTANAIAPRAAATAVTAATCQQLSLF